MLHGGGQATEVELAAWPAADALENGTSVASAGPRPQTLGRLYGEFVDEPEDPGAWQAGLVSARDGQKSAASRSFQGKVIRRTANTARLLVKLAGVGLMVIVLMIAVINWPPWMIEEENARAQVLSCLFVVGLFVVALEDFLDINKSSVMLIMASTMWTFLAVGYHPTQSHVGWLELHGELNKGIQDVGAVILFLLPAMGVVESVDHFDGFAIVTIAIHRLMNGKRHRLIPIISILTFFLSSVIDNLTSTIVALKILRHVVADDREFRKQCGGLAVIAANAGGAWSPIGDVTTTMLWIQGKITAPQTVLWLFVPSLFAGVFPMFGVWWQSSRAQALQCDGSTRAGAATAPPQRRMGAESVSTRDAETEVEPFRLFSAGETAMARVTRVKVLALVLGVMCILLVPVLKMMTGLPPYMGMLLALGLFWLVTDSLSALDAAPVSSPRGTETPGEAGAQNGDASPLPEVERDASGPPRDGVVEALHKVDLTGLLFFAGVLFAVGALNSAGVLHRYANLMLALCRGSAVLLCSLLGVSSAIVDNVPLVEAAIDMFEDVERDNPLWQLVALAAGTGGSLLSIGSIAGVTLMSMEDVGFLWYCKHIAPWAALGFALGIVVYQAERGMFG